ncbi:flagellar hook-length control protein FliK [Rhizobiales bacterium]|uniref:flagellar hook-length control protein FliK n=1 Tax=Hongsoonwoonella zoysiae TaxID=2821844 RepID=UPI0015600502|nr:flagellar hook-length control protein FliK [Hongsoonwoonella zoysiae]NRG19141.1 flagellar hook-length control protein FliK [Hongsoonwoonella zoysiae]
MVTRISSPFGVVPVSPSERVARLEIGDTFVARVARHLGQNTLRLAANGFQLDVESATLLPTGSRVQVTVGRGPDGPRYQLQPLPAENGAGQAANAQGQAAGAAFAKAQVAQVAQADFARTAAQQIGLATLFASLSAIQQAGGAGLPANVQSTIAALLGLRLSGHNGLDGKSLKKASERSGVFSRKGGGPAGLRAGLLSLREALSSSGGQPRAPEADAPDLPSLARHPRGQPKAATPYGIYQALNAGDSQGLIALLLGQTDASLARLRLSALAALGAMGEADGARGTAPLDVTFELPLALGGETAILSMQIGRDEAEGTTPEDTHPAWRLRFAVDLDEIGAVEAMVGLDGKRLFVTLWVERAATLQHMRGDAQAVREDLARMGLHVEDFRLVHGRPSDPPALSGQLVDTLS